MSTSPFQLFTEVTPSNYLPAHALERPKLKNIFSVNKTEIALTLTEQYLVLHTMQGSDAPTHFVALTFDLKFEAIYQPVVQN